MFEITHMILEGKKKTIRALMPQEWVQALTQGQPQSSSFLDIKLQGTAALWNMAPISAELSGLRRLSHVSVSCGNIPPWLSAIVLNLIESHSVYGVRHKFWNFTRPAFHFMSICSIPKMGSAHFGWAWFIPCPADTTGHALLLFAPLFPFALQCPTPVLLRSVYETFNDIAIHGKIFPCGLWPVPVLSTK